MAQNVTGMPFMGQKDDQLNLSNQISTSKIPIVHWQIYRMAGHCSAPLLFSPSFFHYPHPLVYFQPLSIFAYLLHPFTSAFPYPSTVKTFIDD